MRRGRNLGGQQFAMTEQTVAIVRAGIIASMPEVADQVRDNTSFTVLADAHGNLTAQWRTQVEEGAPPPAPSPATARTASTRMGVLED
jgi:hypothetical protein